MPVIQQTRPLLSLMTTSMIMIYIHVLWDSIESITVKGSAGITLAVDG